MLISVAALLLAPAQVAPTTADEYAQCAFIATVRSKSESLSTEEKAAWDTKSGTYINKAIAMAYPGKNPTDDEIATLATRGRDLIAKGIEGFDTETTGMLLNSLLETCDS